MLKKFIVPLFIFMFSSSIGLSKDKVFADDAMPTFRILTDDQNFYFNSFVVRLMENANIDYALSYLPFKRAVWALNSGDANIIGPYPASLVKYYYRLNTFDYNDVIKIPVIVEKIPLYGISLKNIDFVDTFNNQNSIIGFHHYDTAPHTTDENRVIHTKKLDQLFMLLKIGRINMAVLPIDKLENLRPYFKDKEMFISANPISYEDTYMFIHKKYAHISERIGKAFEKQKDTPYFKIIKEKYSIERFKNN